MQPRSRLWASNDAAANTRVNSQTIFEDSAPLTSWRQMSSYDVAKQCQDEIGQLQTFPPVAAVHGDHARCVASDDPRLKGN